MKCKAAVIIPCFKAKEKVGKLIYKIFEISKNFDSQTEVLVLLVNDNCPQNSWMEVESHENLRIYHHKTNRGVGAATLTGFKAALKLNCDVVIKIDADGQHPPEYLLDLIPYVLSLPKYKLNLVKGSRYFYPRVGSPAPFTRRLGSLLLEPIARASLAYRGLTDIANGYLAMNSITLKYLIFPEKSGDLKSRYLFESSLLCKASSLGCEVHEFMMLSRYGPEWTSSMNSFLLIIPMICFWLKSISKRLVNKYIRSLNLGSLLAIIALSNILAAIYIFREKITPNIELGIFVSPGISSTFTTSIALFLISLLLFLYYDYNSGLKTKKIFFSSFFAEQD